MFRESLCLIAIFLGKILEKFGLEHLESTMFQTRLLRFVLRLKKILILKFKFKNLHLLFFLFNFVNATKNAENGGFWLA